MLIYRNALGLYIFLFATNDVELKLFWQYCCFILLEKGSIYWSFYRGFLLINQSRKIWNDKNCQLNEGSNPYNKIKFKRFVYFDSFFLTLKPKFIFCIIFALESKIIKKVSRRRSHENLWTAKSNNNPIASAPHLHFSSQELS